MNCAGWSEDETSSAERLFCEAVFREFDYDPESGAFTRRSNGASAYLVHKPSRYYRCYFQGKIFQAHRLVFMWMTGRFPFGCIDHKDVDPTNNRWENLREATKSQNGANVLRGRHNTSGVKGVSRHSQNNNWVVHIGVRGRVMHVGSFSDLETARAAYADASLRYFGEFARSA